LQIKTKIVGCHTADSKPVKQEVNCTVILPPLVFPVATLDAVCRIFYCYAFNPKGQSTIKPFAGVMYDMAEQACLFANLNPYS
jgi:hypothetical protein